MNLFFKLKKKTLNETKTKNPKPNQTTPPQVITTTKKTLQTNQPTNQPTNLMKNKTRHKKRHFKTLFRFQQSGKTTTTEKKIPK